MAYTINQTANAHQTSVLVKAQLPLFIANSHPIFATFIEKYYEFLANNTIMKTSDANVSYYGADTAFKIMPDVGDIDTTDLELFLESFRKQYAHSLPRQLHANTNVRTLYKNLIDFYRSVGTEDSFKTLFRLLYNDEVELYYPNRDMLIASGGKFNQKVRIKVDYVDNLNDIENKRIVGSKSGAYGTVEKVQVLEPRQLKYIPGRIQNTATSLGYTQGIANTEYTFDSQRELEETNQIAFIYMSDQFGKFEVFEDVYYSDGGSANTSVAANTKVLPVIKRLMFYDDFSDRYAMGANSFVSLTDSMRNTEQNSTTPPWGSANMEYANTGQWHTTGTGTGEIILTVESSNNYIMDSPTTGTVLRIGNNISTNGNTSTDLRHIILGHNIPIGGEDRLYRMQISARDIGGNTATSFQSGNRFSAGVACIRHDLRRLSGNNYLDQWEDPIWLVCHKQPLDDNFFVYTGYFKGRELERVDPYPIKNYGNGGRKDLPNDDGIVRYYNSAEKAAAGHVRLPFNTSWFRPTFKVNEPANSIVTHSIGTTEIDFISIEEIDSMQTQMGRNIGSYENESSQLSTKGAYLYDGYYRQHFSYDIRSKQQKKDYDTVVRETVHPAGLKMFGTKISESSVNVSVNSSRTNFSDTFSPDQLWTLAGWWRADALGPENLQERKLDPDTKANGIFGTNKNYFVIGGSTFEEGLIPPTWKSSTYQGSGRNLLTEGVHVGGEKIVSPIGDHYVLKAKDSHRSSRPYLWLDVDATNQADKTTRAHGYSRVVEANKKWLISVYARTSNVVNDHTGSGYNSFRLLPFLANTSGAFHSMYTTPTHTNFTAADTWERISALADLTTAERNKATKMAMRVDFPSRRGVHSESDDAFSPGTGGSGLGSMSGRNYHHGVDLVGKNKIPQAISVFEPGPLDIGMNGAASLPGEWNQGNYGIGTGENAPAAVTDGGAFTGNTYAIVGANSHTTLSLDTSGGANAWYEGTSLKWYGPTTLAADSDYKAHYQILFSNTHSILATGGAFIEAVPNQATFAKYGISIPIGKSWVYSVYIKAHHLTYDGSNFQQALTWYASNNHTVSNNSVTAADVIDNFQLEDFKSDIVITDGMSEWVRCYVSIDLSSGAKADANSIILGIAPYRTNQDRTAWFDGIQLEEDNGTGKPTEFKLHSSDNNATVYHFDGFMMEEYDSAIHGTSTPYTPSPYVLPGMSGANVVSWYDQSPNKHHVYANTHGGVYNTPQYVANAINSKPAVRFMANTVKNTSNVYEWTSIGGTSSHSALEAGTATNFKTPTSGFISKKVSPYPGEPVGGTLASNSFLRTVSDAWTIMAVVKTNLGVNATSYDTTRNPTIFNSGFAGVRNSSVMNLGYDVVGEKGSPVIEIPNSAGGTDYANTAAITDFRDTYGRTPITDPAGTNFVPRALSIFDSPDADYSIQAYKAGSIDGTYVQTTAPYAITSNVGGWSGVNISIVAGANSVVGGTSLEVINNNIGDGGSDQANARQILFSNTTSSGPDRVSYGQDYYRPPRAVPDVGTFNTYGIQIPKGKRWIYSLHAQANSARSDGIFLSWITSNGTAIPLDHTSIHANTPRSDGFAIAADPNSTDLTRYQTVIDLTGDDGPYYANNSADSIILGFQVKRTDSTYPTVFYVDALQLEEVATGVTTPTTFQLPPGAFEASPSTEDSFRIVGVSVDASGIDYHKRYLFGGTLGTDASHPDYWTLNDIEIPPLNADDEFANVHYKSTGTDPILQKAFAVSDRWKGSDYPFIRMSISSNTAVTHFPRQLRWLTTDSGTYGTDPDTGGKQQFSYDWGMVQEDNLWPTVFTGFDNYIDFVWDMRNAPLDNSGKSMWMDRTITQLRLDPFSAADVHFNIKEISISKQNPTKTPDHLNFHIDGRRFANSEINNSQEDLSVLKLDGHNQNNYVISIGKTKPIIGSDLPFPVYPEANGIMGVGATGNVNFLVNISNTNILPAPLHADGFWGEMYVSNLGGIDFVSPNGSIIPTHSGDYGIKITGTSTIYTHYEGDDSASDTPTRGTGEDAYLMYSNMNAAARFGTGTGVATDAFGNHMHIIPVEWDAANNTWLALYNLSAHAPDGTAATAFVPDTANGDFLVARMRRVDPGVGHTGLTEFESFIFAANSQNQSYSGGIGNASVLGTHTGFSNQKREVKHWAGTTYISNTYFQEVYGHSDWDGDIAEVLVFNEKLSNTEIARTEGYLAHKYGLQENLIHKDGAINEHEKYNWKFTNTPDGWNFPSSGSLAYGYEGINNHITVTGGNISTTSNMQIDLPIHIDGTSYDHFQIRYLVDANGTDTANVFQFGWKNDESSTVHKLSAAGGAGGYTAVDAWYQNTYNLSGESEWKGKKITYLEYSFITGDGADDYKIDFARVYGNNFMHPYRKQAPLAIGANTWYPDY